jgi:DNA repair protein RadC
MRDAEVESAISVREMPVDERPRERLLRAGARALSDAELIAVLLRTGHRRASALTLARDLLRQSGGLLGLLGMSAEAIRRDGLGPAKTAALLAGVELGRRLARADIPDKDPMTHPEVVARYLFLRFGVRDQEIMGALYLDTRNRLMAESETFRGTLNRAAVEPGALLKTGLLHGAAGLVVFHTHPSGDPSPSAEDLAFTRRLAEAGRTVGIRLVDHLILGSGERWISLRQRGAW